MTLHSSSSQSTSSAEEVRQRQPNSRPYNSDEDVVRLLFIYFSNLWNRLKIHTDRFLSKSGLYETLDKLARQSAKHPYLATTLSIGFILFGIPLLIIAIFVLSTIAFTFTGIIFIEGTLISIASVLLFGCLGAALIVFIFFGCLALASYFGFLHIYGLFNSIIKNNNALENFINQERSRNN